MISRRGTKIIADARGAYLAGRVSGITLHLSAAGAERLHKALVQQAIDCVRYATITRGDSASIGTCLQTAERWLIDPTSENAQRCEAVLLETNVIANENNMAMARMGSVTPPPEGWFGWMIGAFVNVIQPNDVIEASKQARMVATCVPMVRRGKPMGAPGVMDESRRLEAACKQWQLDAAWAILQGKEPPRLRCHHDNRRRADAPTTQR